MRSAALSPADFGQLAASIQPLVFETGIPETPYATLGTVFLVGFEGRAFVLTSRHGLNPDNLSPVCVFPSDTSRRLLPLKDVFFVSERVTAEDFVDIAVIEIDLSRIAHPELGSARLIALGPSTHEWVGSAANCDFAVLGFPEEHSYVDYDEEVVATQRLMVLGRYTGVSPAPYCHELEVVDGPELSTYSGFSGAPVFARHRGESDIALCGMALRGTATGRRLHFLERSVLLDALRIKCAKT